MNTIREKVEAYVRSQIPELMKLSFGCKLKEKGGEVVFTAIGKPYQAMHWNFVKVAEREEVDNGLNTLGIEIIGHTIQLSHILQLLPRSEWETLLRSWDVKKSWEQQSQSVYNGLAGEWNI